MVRTNGKLGGNNYPMSRNRAGYTKERYQRELQRLDWTIAETSENLDEAVENYTKNMKAALDYVAPMRITQ